MNDNARSPEERWPVRPYPKRQLALAYSNLDNGRCALRQLWTLLGHARVDGVDARRAVRALATKNTQGRGDNAQFFSNEQVAIIFRALGRP